MKCVNTILMEEYEKVSNMTKEQIKNSKAFKFILNYLKNHDLFYTGDDDYINEKIDELIKSRKTPWDLEVFSMWCLFSNKLIKDRFENELHNVEDIITRRGNKVGKRTMEQLDRYNEQYRYYADRVSENLALYMRGVTL